MNKFLSVFGGLMLILSTTLCSDITWAQLTTVNFNPTQDAQMSSKIPSTPNGSSTTFNVGFDASNLIRRAAIKFDLSSIPSNVTILSAHLYFKPKSPLSNGTYTNTRLSKYVASWAESSITYANAPGVDANGTSTSVGENGWRKFEVTTDVKGFVDGSYSNNGWQLRMSNETTSSNFEYYSREYSTSSFRPYLVVKYYYPITVTDASIGHVSEITETDGSINPTISGGSGSYTYEWTNGATGSVISTSSTLSGVGYGWYGLHVSDATYSTETYMAFLVGAECSSVTIDFKPGPDYVDDALLFNQTKNGIVNGNNNFGGAQIYSNENWFDESWFNIKNVLKFNLWLDSDAQIDKADLYLYASDHYPKDRSNISELRYLSNPWDENLITYNNAPNYTSSPIKVIPETSSSTETKVLDISDFWDLWKLNNSENYGMLMQLQSYTNVRTRMRFHSSDATTPANRPWIQFEINLEDVAGCPSITPTWDADSETGIIDVDITPFGGAGAPYQYIISTEPIAELTETYHFIHDSLGFDIDSTQFFAGKENSQTYQFNGLDAGTYFVSVFDKIGERILDRSKHVQGALVFDQQTGLTISGNKISATAANGVGSLKLYMSESTEYSSFETTLESLTVGGGQFVGLSNSDKSASDYRDLDFGFRVQGSSLYTVKYGVATSVTGTLVAGDVLKMEQEGNTIKLVKNSTTIVTETLPSKFTYKISLGTQLQATLSTKLTGKYYTKPFRFDPAVINHLSCDQAQGSFSFSVNLLGALNGQTASYSIVNSSTNEVVAQDLTVQDQVSIVPVSTLISGQPLTPGIYQVTLVIGGQTYVETIYFGYEVSWAQDIDQYSQLPTPNSVKRDVATSSNNFSFARARNINTSSEGWIKFKARTGQNSVLAGNSFMRFGYPNFYSPISFSGSDAYLFFLPWTNNTMYVSYSDGQNFSSISYLGQGTEFLIRYTNSQIRIYRNNTLWQTFPTTSFNGITGVNCQSLTLNDAFENVITSFGCSPSQPESTVDHAELKKKLDGGYALAVEGIIKFTFDEEYEVMPSFLPFKIFNNQRGVVASSDISGNVTGGISSLPYQVSDGRYQIDISNISGMNIGEFYTIEVTTQKGDKQYLKFLYKNQLIMTSYVHKEKINRILSVLVVYALMFQLLVPFAAAMNTINDPSNEYSIYALDNVHPPAESIEILDEFETSFNIKSSQKVSSVASVSGGPGQTEISGSTANLGGGLVNSFTGDLTYSLPLMNVEGFPIVLSYDPNIGMDQEASWVGLGWNLSLGSINREMRGIPDDFKGDEVERTVKMKENTVDGKGWSANLTAGYGNNISFNLSGTATILGGDVNMSANGNVGLGISYSRGKYTNNYTGDGRTRSFNLSGSLNLGGSASASVLTIGANGALSGGIGFNKDSQNGKGFSQYFSHNVGGSASIFGVGYDAGYSGFGNTTSNSRSGVKSNDSGLGTTSGLSFLIYSTGNSSMHGSHRTFGAQTFVPRFSSGNITSSSYTTKNFNLSAQLGVYSAGGGGGKNTHESNTTVLQETIKYPAYGYQNHSRGQKDSRSMLDFNRERNSAVSTATQLLSFSVQTYDVFYCSAPGFSTSFRPHRYDVVEYHDPTIQSTANSQVPKGDIKEQNVHGGMNAAGFPTGGYTTSEQGATSSSITQSGTAIEQSYFNGVSEENTFNEKEYYLKTQGELSQVDLTLLSAYQGAEPKLLEIDLDPLSNEFLLNGTLSNGTTGQLNPPSPVALPNTNYSFARSENAVHYIERTIDEMAIPKVYSEVTIVENVPHISEVNASFITEQKAGHHTGSIEVVSNNGMRYIYGVPTYNYLQKEVSFSASGRLDELFYKSTGLLQYQEGVDNTTNNSLGRHESFEQTITPAYSTAFLLTEMLTSDFIDRTGDGPSVDDQGNYYLLKYSNPYNGRKDDGLSPDVWKWRMPLCSNLSNSALGDSYEKSLAYANKNIYSDEWDDMGSYIYGEKDIWYNSVVESKNMVAFFVLEDRKDQFSMIDENGGLDQTKPGKCLKRILLYSKNDLLENPTTAKAIQIVEFEYSYELCPNYVGNINTYAGGSSETGKLTLNRIFVYSGKSGEGKTTPITFEYSQNNPSFAFNSSDRWGNYKPNNTSLPNHEFPYAEQSSNAEINILAWKLVSVEQSAGTKLNITYKPDDYAKVQNKRAMRMFSVAGMSSTDDLQRISGGAVDSNNDPIAGSVINSDLSLLQINPTIDHYRNPNDRNDFYNVVYFKLEEPIPASTPNITEKIKKEYLTDETGSVVDKLYFKMHTRLDNNNILPLLPEPYSTPGFEYVESEVFIGKLYTSSFCGVAGISDGSSNYAYEYGWVIIEAEDVKEKSKDKYKDAIGEPVPSALDSDIDDDEASDILLNPLQIAAFQFAQANVPCMIYGEINYGASGPTEFCDYNLQNDGNIYGINLYKRLNKKEYALKFDRKESLVRLYDPNNVKIGGGCRIEKITITDNWFDYSGQDEVSTEYSYEYDYGQVSNETHGVASYEPQIGNNENPFYTFLAYDLARNRMPDERVYQKDPWGELAFPGASVGYSEVKSSLFDGSVVGYSIEEFYTLADEGTKTKRTNIKKHELAGKEDAIKLNKYYKEVFGFSQGFYIETSDFHGKPKTTSTYDNGGNLISKSTIEYYGEDESLKFIDSKGEIITSLTPRDIDIHADSWRSKSYTFSQRSGSTKSVGFSAIVPIYRDRDSDDYTIYENALNAYTFNKIVHRYAVPKAIQTTYLGSKNTARNEYFDIHSGEVIVSSLKDEYNDKLYSVSYPGHWYYENFENMAHNDGAILKPGEFIGTSNSVQISSSIHGISFHEGDKLKIYEQTSSGITNVVDAWLLHDLAGNFTLIDEDGISISTINWNSPNLRVKIERTGSKNILSASMMGVTTKKLDAPVNNEFSFPTTNVLSSSAAKFAQNSNVACVPLSQVGNVDMNNYPDQLEPGNVINPYLKGVKGNYRHLSSFAFQEERDESDPNTLRQNAVLSNYEPFYALDNGEWYSIDESNHPNNTSAGNYNDWRQLGVVNKFDEFGKPLQSKDQIDVSSAVAYGMNGDLKLMSKATAMNAEATEIGFDGFEDYAYFTSDNLDYQNYGFSLKPSNIANIVSSQKHSGKYSLKVQGQLEFSFDTEVSVAQPSESNINQYVVEECDCIQGFAPKAGEEYFLSTWVHENTLVYPFTGSSVSLQFFDVNGSFISSTQLFTPEGAVIDGWQKIEGKYTIPSQAKSFKVVLIGNSESFFDDFRMHPHLAGMTTVVYDQDKLLPIAEHDGYNYTTFYQYDENYQLVRVRVETIEGIKTISESESGSSRN